MPHTNGSGTFEASGPEHAEPPIAGFDERLDAREELSTQLAKLNGAGVVSRHWQEVREYLERYPDLAAMLPTICDRARQEFQPPNELALQMYRDPEIKDEYLTLYIRQVQYEPSIIARIERLSDLFSDRFEREAGYLLLTTDFRSPRGNDVL